MTDNDFIKKWVGTRWVDRGIDENGIDCWGVVYRWMTDVENLHCSKPSDFSDITDGFSSEIRSGRWEESAVPKRGIVFMCFLGSQPMHCGVVISDTHVIHSSGNPLKGGSVSVNSIKSLERLFGKMKFFRRLTA